MKIKNRLWLFALALSISVQPASFAARAKIRVTAPMTVGDVMNMRVVSDPRISPSGSAVAFVVTQADMKTNFRNSDVWIVEVGDDKPPTLKLSPSTADLENLQALADNARPLTQSPKRDDSPQWSNDSRRLALISDRYGRAQV